MMHMVGGTREKASKSSEARGQLLGQTLSFRRCYRGYVSAVYNSRIVAVTSSRAQAMCAD